MRTPSRSAFLYAMGLLAATGAAGIVGISSANASPSHASPSHARSAPASVSMTVPGTGVTVTTDMDDNGDVMDTTAGDDANDQNETEANDVNDDNSAPAPGATETADSSGNDANDASDANDANDAMTTRATTRTTRTTTRASTPPLRRPRPAATTTALTTAVPARMTAAPAATARTTRAAAATTDVTARTPRRGARSAAAPLVLFLGAAVGLIGCSSSDHAVNSSSTPKTPTTSTSATPSGDAQAIALLAKAETTLAADSSYRFDAVQTVAAGTPVTTHVSGAVVRNTGVSYALTVGKTTTKVVRIKGATFVRKLPGKWVRLQKPRPVADPTTSLAAILKGLTGVQTVNASTVAGTLPPAAAKSAGIPTGSEPAQVTVTVDAAGHVTRVTVHTSTQAGSTPVAVTLVTSYSAFGRVPALHRPV